MKFELIKNSSGLEMYGDIPCLPVEYNENQGMRFDGDESDSWLLLDDFVPAIDEVCPNDLDYGDVDYFDEKKCRILKSWLEKRVTQPMSPRLQQLYQVLGKYINDALLLGTGVVIEL